MSKGCFYCGNEDCGEDAKRQMPVLAAHKVIDVLLMLDDELTLSLLTVGFITQFPEYTELFKDKVRSRMALRGEG